MLVVKRRLVSQCKRIPALTCASFEELGFKVAPSFIRYKCPLSTPIEGGDFGTLKTFCFRLELKIDGFNQKMKRPAMKPSSLKLITRKDQNSLTLAYHTPFRYRRFQMCVAAPSMKPSSLLPVPTSCSWHGACPISCFLTPFSLLTPKFFQLSTK